MPTNATMVTKGLDNLETYGKPNDTSTYADDEENEILTKDCLKTVISLMCCEPSRPSTHDVDCHQIGSMLSLIKGVFREIIGA